MQMTPEQVALIKQVIENQNEHIATMQADTRDDYILVWNHGGAVAFNEKGDPFYTHVAHAHTVATKHMPGDAFAYIPQVLNGDGEQARMVLRQDALKKALPETIAFRDDLQAKLEIITA